MGDAHGLFQHSVYNTKHIHAFQSQIYIYIYIQIHCHTQNFEKPQRRHKKMPFCGKSLCILHFIFQRFVSSTSTDFLHEYCCHHACRHSRASVLLIPST